MDAFVFYRNFYEAIKMLPEKSDQADVYEAIAAYSLDGTAPSLTGVSAAVFTIIKPVLDKNIQRAANGKKGGRPKQNQMETNTKPNDNQTETKEEPIQKQTSKNQNLIKNKELIINNEELILIHSEDKSSSRRQQEITFGYDTDSRLHGITSELITLWKGQFPAVDVEQEIRNAENWLDCNRSQRKYDIKRFLGNWLRRTQDRARAITGQSHHSTYNKFDGNTHPVVTEEEREANGGF